MFKYSIIKMFRSFGGLFWMFIFPLALMTAMHFAFSSIYAYQNSIDPMKTILITEGEGVYQQGFEELIDNLSEEGSEDQLFILEDADSLEDAHGKGEKQGDGGAQGYHGPQEDGQFFLLHIGNLLSWFRPQNSTAVFESQEKFIEKR